MEYGNPLVLLDRRAGVIIGQSEEDHRSWMDPMDRKSHQALNRPADRPKMGARDQDRLPRQRLNERDLALVLVKRRKGTAESLDEQASVRLRFRPARGNVGCLGNTSV